jgi:hypothetical protein
LTHIAKTKVVVLTAAVALVSGCKSERLTASPEDYYPLIQVALEGGKLASLIGRNESIKDSNFAGCVSSDVLASAFDSASVTLSGRLTGEDVFPGFSLDLTDCLTLPHGDAKSSEDAAVLVEAIAGVALSAVRHYANKLKRADCEKGSAALAAVSYVYNMVPIIADEIANPDGVVTVDPVTIDYLSCVKN